MNMTLLYKNMEGKQQHETGRSAPLYFFAILLASWLWPTIAVGTDLQQHRNEQWKFRVSYPQSWKAVPTKGSNVRFAAVSLGEGGNCNVTVIVHSDTSTTSQQLLNGDVSNWFLDKKLWSKLLGDDANEVDVLSSRVGAIYGVTALIGTVEARLENLAGKFLRRQDIAVALTPGRMWVVNCGVSSADDQQARLRYTELKSDFNTVFASFAFLR